VKIFQIEKEKEPIEKLSYKLHLYGINQIKWNTDGSLLASCSNDCQINVFDINNVSIKHK
jgi:WD40 repeat protein